MTDKEIRVGAIYMHGMQLASFMPKPMERIIEAQLRVMNDQGGIHGRKFKYIGCDDGVPDAARTRACYKKLVEQDKIFAFLGGLTFNSGLIQPDIERDKVPALAPGSLYRSEWENPWSFAIHMGMEHEAHAGGQWVVDVLKPKTIGLLCLNNAEMQATCDASTAVMKKHGIEVVHRVTTSAETPDMSGDVLAMRAANPDHIIHYTTHPAATARFMLDASQQDYWPPKGISGNHMAGEFAGALIGNYPAKHGYWTNTTYKLWGPELVSWSRKYVPDQEGLHNHVMQGQWWATNVFFDVLKKMGPNVTREGLKQALETGEYTHRPGPRPEVHVVTEGPQRRRHRRPPGVHVQGGPLRLGGHQGRGGHARAASSPTRPGSSSKTPSTECHVLRLRCRLQQRSAAARPGSRGRRRRALRPPGRVPGADLPGEPDHRLRAGRHRPGRRLPVPVPHDRQRADDAPTNGSPESPPWSSPWLAGAAVGARLRRHGDRAADGELPPDRRDDVLPRRPAPVGRVQPPP